MESGSDRFPPAPKATREAADAFMQSLLPSAIEALASKHNNGKACTIFSRLYGSFNVCFFVRFEDGLQWTVRNPIIPRLHEPWQKLESEVVTLKVSYLRARTSIPVPIVCAFGNDAMLTNDGSRQMFLISEFINGVPLMSERLADADDASRKTFFLQLFDYLAQLRCLEFSTIGSLTPSTSSSSSPAVGKTMSFSTNHLQLQLPSFTSTKDYLLSQSKMLRLHIDVPIADYSETDSRYELFALNTFQTLFENFASDALVDEPFVLNHADLHLCNILVDSDLKIVGIIDWEFANIVPLRLFMPPLWAIYQDPGLENLSSFFFKELKDAATGDGRLGQLLQHWYGKMNFFEPFTIARLIRHPTDMTDIFATYFTQKQMGDDIDAAEVDFFINNPEVAAEAQQAALRNARWTQHLKDTGMYESNGV
ncbi:hypothetical protein LLEC1_07196 [Akanthomyces lecanii]|uniref:Aminoglycoside phosphotransferase domain-containing protein n=1 Tax=Cordyceps confragosa TaxID=2714763 RepID=A0A179I7X9_CORDF|nr:hypothetical protein LLEC1_07196 [Akanthomyces lecanii]